MPHQSRALLDGLVSLALATLVTGSYIAQPSTPTAGRRTLADSDSASFVRDAHHARSAIAMSPDASLNIETLGAIDGGRCYEVAVRNKVLYGGFSEVLQSFDITNPSAPKKLSSLVLGDVVNGIAINNTRAYVSAATAGLYVIDISNPSDLRVITRIPSLERSRDLVAHGPTLYLADGAGGVRAFDITNPENPTELWQWPTTSARHIVLSGTRAFVSDGAAGVVILDVEQPAPVLLGSYDTPGDAWATAPFGNYLCVADGGGGFRVLDVSNVATPTLVGVALTFMGSVFDVEIDGAYAFVANDYLGLSVLDISTPSLPVVVSSPDQFVGAFGHDVDVANGYVILAHNYTGASIFTCTLPAAPVTGGSLSLSGTAVGIFVQGNLAFVAGGDCGASHCRHR